jgi:hypothetical protein
MIHASIHVGAQYACVCAIEKSPFERMLILRLLRGGGDGGTGFRSCNSLAPEVWNAISVIDNFSGVTVTLGQGRG